MKRILSVVLLVFVILPVFADGSFSFEPYADSPLYKESASDPYAFNTNLSMVFALDNNQKATGIRSIIVEHDPLNLEPDRAFYQDLGWDDDSLKEDNNSYVHMKTGVALGLLRMRLEGYEKIPALDFELNLNAYINTLFCNFMKNETLAFDGSFLVGASMRVADLVTLRGGLHHFSGHYGDEVLAKYYNYNQVDFSRRYDSYNGNSLESSGSLIKNYAEQYGGDVDKEYYLNGTVEYVRDNSLIAGVQAELPWNIRVYGEAELPMKKSWIRPLAHVPADYSNPVDESGRPTLIDRIGGDAIDGEHISKEQLVEQQELMRTNKAYKAWRIHTGAEYRYNLDFGSLFASGDVQLHQDGQTKHNLNTYSKDNPWDLEYTIGGGLEVNGPLSDYAKVRIEAYYHYGRTYSTQWFYQMMPSVTVGIGLF